MRFEQLQNYRNGQLWHRLLKVHPQPQSLPAILHPLYDFEPRQPVIYHYTDVSGLHGILQSNRLWASAAYYLNDSSEIEYGCKLALEAIAVWKDVNQRIQSFAVDALRGLESIFSHPLSRISRSATIYVTCFCENDNLLSQWRAYGQAGGYSLGFEVDKSWRTMALRVPGEFWDLRLAQVIYDEEHQRMRINSLLTQVFEAIRAALPGGGLSRGGIDKLPFRSA